MAKVKNHDVLGLYNRMNRFLVEFFKAVSSETSEMNEFDQARCATYLDAIDNYHAWVIAQPQLDLPETAPREYELETPPNVPIVENESINDICRLLVVGRDELINSQSARTAAGLNQFDSGRLTAIIAKTRAFLTDYVQATTPLDLPESSPKAPSSGAGLTGI